MLPSFPSSTTSSCILLASRGPLWGSRRSVCLECLSGFTFDERSEGEAGRSRGRLMGCCPARSSSSGHIARLGRTGDVKHQHQHWIHFVVVVVVISAAEAEEEAHIRSLEHTDDSLFAISYPFYHLFRTLTRRHTKTHTDTHRRTQAHKDPHRQTWKHTYTHRHRHTQTRNDKHTP